jgi:predicted Zn-dependent peptidase
MVWKQIVSSFLFTDSCVLVMILQLLQQLHAENMLGYRFPIGLEEQIKKWDPETIKAFHERWYFPANATLFVVGDIGSVSRTLEMIEVQLQSGAPSPTPMLQRSLKTPFCKRTEGVFRIGQ